MQERGYNLSEKKIDDFRKQHGIKRGDTVLVRGRVVGRPISYGVKFESPNDLDATTNTEGGMPQWVADVLKRVEAGEEVVITILGTAEHSSLIKYCKLVE